MKIICGSSKLQTDVEAQHTDAIGFVVSLDDV